MGQPLQPEVPLAVLCAAKGLDDWLSCNGNIWAVGRILDKLVGKERRGREAVVSGKVLHTTSTCAREIRATGSLYH